MQGDKIVAAQAAAAAAIEQILDGTWFAVIAGTDGATRIFPYPNAPTAMVQMESAAREEAKRAVTRLLAGGGTAMGAWLRLAKRIFEATPQATQRHAILLTDGRNQSEPPEVLAPRSPRSRSSCSATAAVSESTGTSPSCAGWPRRCSARWTSSPTPG